MKLQFSADLDYQTEAINAAVHIFHGQPAISNSHVHTAVQNLQIGGMFQNEQAFGNQLLIDDAQMLLNIQQIQSTHKLPNSESLGKDYNFSIAMETGTGKTYVYIRTIFELHKTYGFSKFVIVVPSIAVREGVLGTLERMRGHLAKLYHRPSYQHFVYNSAKLSEIRQFANASHIQIMVINIQSFVRDIPDEMANEHDLRNANVIHRESDRMGGKPIEYIRATQPIVIIDEPQSVDNTPKAKRAIQSLNPLVRLRYSATHKNPYNLLYNLDPVAAYNKGLVKKVDVASIQTEDAHNNAYVKLLQVDYTKGIRARVEIHKQNKQAVTKAVLWVKNGDDLYTKSKKLELYRHNCIITGIDGTPGHERITLSAGTRISLGQDIGGYGEETMRLQIHETIEQHFRKEQALRRQGKNIKVLSLFFLDRVANYRQYHEDGTTSLGKIGEWFEEYYRKLSTQEHYQEFAMEDISCVHNGYFAKDKKGKSKDTRGNTKDDESAYELIMRNKEALLDPSQPLRFIFAHSALREGWDNPNVFQICTLNETQSRDKKRQELGRGMRLCVNAKGRRIFDDRINVLTVIVNESYKTFVEGLQKEFADEGVRFDATKIQNARDKITPTFNKQIYLNEDFKELWERIQNRTRYRVQLSSAQLIKDAVHKIQSAPRVPSPKLRVEHRALAIEHSGVHADSVRREQSYAISSDHKIPDPLHFLENATQLTRATLGQILLLCGRLEDFRTNPSRFLENTRDAIRHVLQAQILEGIQYEKIPGVCWDMNLIEEEGIARYLKDLYKVQNTDKAPYDYLASDSDVEHAFAKKLDEDENILLFFKMPRRFTIETPLGNYNPDWAFVRQDQKKLYFVHETKAVDNTDKLRPSEKGKVDCGEKHFHTLGVTYTHGRKRRSSPKPMP